MSSMDGLILTLLSAFGVGGSAVVGALWKSLKGQIDDNVKRLTECEADRERLHQRLSEHAEKLAHLEGFIEGQKAIGMATVDNSEATRRHGD